MPTGVLGTRDFQGCLAQARGDRETRMQQYSSRGNEPQALFFMATLCFKNTLLIQVSILVENGERIFLSRGPIVVFSLVLGCHLPSPQTKGRGRNSEHLVYKVG